MCEMYIRFISSYHAIPLQSNIYPIHQYISPVMLEPGGTSMTVTGPIKRDRSRFSAVFPPTYSEEMKCEGMSMCVPEGWEQKRGTNY